MIYDFLRMGWIKAKLNKRYCIKLIDIVQLKKLSKMKNQSIEWEMFKNNMSDNRLVSKIYK